MIRLASYYFFAILLISSCTLSARTRKKVSPSPAPKLVSATVQRTMPGMRDAPMTTTYRILLVWNGAAAPETFFWRPEGDRWMTCQATRVHKKGRTAPADPMGLWYETEVTRLQDVRKGDTLELVPLTGGRDIMPAAAKPKGVQSIYYYTAKGNWQTIPVSAFRKLPDLIMP